MTKGPRIEFLWWRECPSSERALEELRAEVAAAGLNPADVEVSEVKTEEEATRLRFAGSPTIRVDGTDVDGGGAQEEPFGLTCRVYRRADGRVSPLPDPERISAALRAATEGAAGE
jgi:hypothetical protein